MSSIRDSAFFVRKISVYVRDVSAEEAADASKRAFVSFINVVLF